MSWYLRTVSSESRTTVFATRVNFSIDKVRSIDTNKQSQCSNKTSAKAATKATSHISAYSSRYTAKELNGPNESYKTDVGASKPLSQPVRLNQEMALFGLTKTWRDEYESKKLAKLDDNVRGTPGKVLTSLSLPGEKSEVVTLEELNGEIPPLFWPYEISKETSRKLSNLEQQLWQTSTSLGALQS